MRGSSRSDGRAWICAGLVACVFLLYGRIAHNGFVSLDDEPYITGNPHVRAGLTWNGVKWAFTTAHESNWHPLTWLSHMADAQLFGLDPGAHHLVSVAFHAASAVLLFLAFAGPTGAVWTSAFLAALFAVHPLRVESVAWAAERKDVLSGFFFMLSLHAYLRYVRRPDARRYALLFALAACGLMAKPMLVTLPFVLLLLDIWPLERVRWPSSFLEKIPLLALSAASSLVTVVVQQRGGSVQAIDKIPIAARVANAAQSYAAYLVQSFWPARLAVVYPHPALLPGGGKLGGVLPAVASGILLLLATVFALKCIRKRPFVAVGWFWFLGMLVPVIGLVQVGIQARADRYTYLPLIGIHLGVAWAGREVARRWPVSRRLLTASAVAALAGLSGVTWVQAGYWRDSVTLYRHALAATRDNFVVHNNLGSALAAQGKRTEAAAEYARALAIDPDYAIAHYNAGVLLQQTGEFVRARAAYERALELRPHYTDARNNLAGLLVRAGDIDGAVAQYRALLRDDPECAPARYNLGLQLARKGDLTGAAAAFEALLQSDPMHTEANNNLGSVLLDRGRYAEAAARFEQVLRIRPDDYDATFNLGIACAQRGDLTGALARFERAARLRPGEEARAAIERTRSALAGRP